MSTHIPLPLARRMAPELGLITMERKELWALLVGALVVGGVLATLLGAWLR